MFKLKDKIDRKFIYQIKEKESVFRNSIYMVNLTKSKIMNEKMQDFITFCNENEVDSSNFMLASSTYILTTDDIHNVVISINEFGLHWKHMIEENIESLEFDDVYNFRYDNDNIYYSYREKDFLAFYKNYTKSKECDFLVDRKTELLLKDYLNLGFYDFKINLEKISDGDMKRYIIKTENDKAQSVYEDFLYFLFRNQVECPVCKKIVDNAFDEYMIQFYKHDGCM